MKKTLLFLTSLSICFFLAEWFLSSVFPAPSYLKINVHSYGANYELSPNRDLIYVPKPNIGQHNKYGHRGKAYPIEKQELPRIMFIGDSVVEGFFVNEEKRFTSILERQFNEKCDIINIAVRGYNLRQTLAYLKEVGLTFKPDHIIWGITFNDLVLDSGEIFNIDERLKSKGHDSFYAKYYRTKGDIESYLMNSNIYRHLVYLNSEKSNDDFRDEISYKIDGNEIAESFREIMDLGEEHGFGVTLLYLPINTSDLDQINEIKLNSAKLDIRAIDLDVIVNETPLLYSKADLFIENDPCHLSHRGHIVVADLLEEYLGELINLKN